MAAKKKTARKTVKKAAKKTVKKTVKKAAKKASARKVAKKAAVKKAPKKKEIKKAAKKVTKKAVKKVIKKKVAKKKTAVKKSAPKKVVKKAAKKAVPKKTVKKTTKAAAKKAPLKKAIPAKKEAPKKKVKLIGFAKKQHQKLLDLRDGILDAMYGVTHDQLKNTDGMETGGGGMHTGDAGSDSYDRDFALNLLAKEQDALSEIEQAIQRAETGVYGICEMSGEKIPKERLEAIPFARYTVACQAKWEKENGHLRRQGNTEFGFSNGSRR